MMNSVARHWLTAGSPYTMGGVRALRRHRTVGGLARPRPRRSAGAAGAPALMRVWFLDANDAAVSKYARGEPRDQRWIRSGVLNGLISLPVVTARLRTT